MDDVSLVATVALVLGAALLGGMVARRLGQPVLLGYIVAGAVIGPHTPGLSTERGQVVVLASLGMAFLMFALGLEFLLEVLMRWLGVSAADARTLVADERDGFYALEHARRVRRAHRSTRAEETATSLPVTALAE